MPDNATIIYLYPFTNADNKYMLHLIYAFSISRIQCLMGEEPLISNGHCLLKVYNHQSQITPTMTHI